MSIGGRKGVRCRGRWRLAWAPAVMLLIGCGSDGGTEEGERMGSGSRAADTAQLPNLLTVLDELPPGVQWSLDPWTGDLPAMTERRVVRLLTVHEPMFFGFTGSRQVGLVAEAAAELEGFLNARLDLPRRLYVFIQPVSRDLLIPFLVEGRGDIAAAGLTITPERLEAVDFTRPFATGVSEILVTGPAFAGPVPERLDGLDGAEIHVRRSSSYWNSLQELDRRLRARGGAGLHLVVADELLADEDLMEQVNAGNTPAIVVDAYQAEFWAAVYPEIRLHHHLAVRTDGEVAWAIRKGSPALMETLNEFVRRHRQGTLTGNIVIQRYTEDTTRVLRARDNEQARRLVRLQDFFRTSAEEYGLDWVLLAAQAFQESRLGADTRNSHGAVGIMQIKPAAAAEAGVPDVSTDESNIRAGAAYLRLLADRYFDDPGLDDRTRQLFAIAAYNAGPTRIRDLRRRTPAGGLDPNLWFDNVEVLAAREIGSETVRYVANIFKYYVTFRLLVEEQEIMESRER